jgi:NAD(P)H-dependent FMN reductase
MPARFLALGGSHGRNSLTNSLLALSARIAADFGAEPEVLTVRDLALDMFDPDAATVDDPRVARLLRAASDAQSVLIASPIYGGTPSGAVKNVLDTLHLGKVGDIGPLRGRKVVVAAVGGGALRGTYHSQRGATATLEIACKNLGAWVDPQHVELNELMFDTVPELRDAVGHDEVRSAVRRLLGAPALAAPLTAGGTR